MQDVLVASRYAKSLLQLAVERNVLDFLNHDMDLFSKVCAENPALVRTLRSPIITSDKKLTILRRLFDGKVNPLTISLFEILGRKGRENYLPEIATSFKSQYQQLKGIVVAEVTTTFPLSDDLRSSFKNIVSEGLGKQVDLKEKVDANLIGGFILKVGDKQLDQSVQAKLRRLKNKMLDSTYIVKY
ncbi:MAG: ATP synthase F1 subunit delta [Cytophagaceae bacterium]|jgi:F-type H+-transporting ATPase subunit delta|nr:ATP synthase F1 subunit delta [Cytophagaceae bacterium]